MLYLSMSGVPFPELLESSMKNASFSIQLVKLYNVYTECIYNGLKCLKDKEHPTLCVQKNNNLAHELLDEVISLFLLQSSEECVSRDQ